MKKLYFTRISALLMIFFPMLLTAQQGTNSKEQGSTQPADSTSCGVLDYGGQKYRTVMIGTQCWMKDNLNIGKWVYQGQQDNQKNDQVIEKYCFGDNFINCDQWGGLYEWDEMMQYVRTENAQGICPPGWHIPSSADWKTLIRYLGGDEMAGGKMKYTGSNGWQLPNVAATNISGFTALPGGYFDTMARQWHDAGRNGYFWSSETISATTSVAMTLSFRKGDLDLYEEYNPSALSVRCIRNK